MAIKAFAFAIVVAACAAGPAHAASDLASAMVDHTLFRDGEVTSMRRTYGDWTLICDEIIRLKRRFCSLRTHVASVGGAASLVVDISTGDDGRPAGLLHVPVGLSLTAGVTVRPVSARPTSRRFKSIQPVSIAICLEHECEGVWTLRPDEMAALDNGTGLNATYVAVAVTDFTGLSVRVPTQAPATWKISGHGFHDAVVASLH